MDETYVKVGGKWAYLYRAVDKHGDTIDFYLSPTRTTQAAKRFLAKALRDMRGEARIVERAFGIGPCVLAETMQFVTEQMELEAA